MVGKYSHHHGILAPQETCPFIYGRYCVKEASKLGEKDLLPNRSIYK